MGYSKNHVFVSLDIVYVFLYTINDRYKIFLVSVYHTEIRWYRISVKSGESYH
ncbi:hypothetical protein BRYFOR_09373 [Marvinbryantia formatexigens DSM 14469]|uniref:Uncharacterized protein n=1 Tax=Marvinbryantia formatexigens DSM 14469 TaxID=478749 RepID=C6LL27_9FIRM|nr:hypothetical protein BRYFOR_09373 [Marvinbryantia formatexigens DSM 14469]